MKSSQILSLLVVISCIQLGVIASKSTKCPQRYEPNWNSLDSRETPNWWVDAKFGIFIHWGVYSVPSFAIPGPCCPDDLANPYAEWYWYGMENTSTATYKFHTETYGEDFHYQDFATQFTAEMFDPDAWAGLFKQAGARYIVLTSKHHGKEILKEFNFEQMGIVCGEALKAGIGIQWIDLITDLKTAIDKQGIPFGLYYSLFEWYNPIYLTDPKSYVDDIMLPQLYDLVAKYEPAVLWGDGCNDWSSDFWHTKEFLAWLFNESPVCDTIAVNDRWGNDTQWKHGGYYCSEYEWPDYKQWKNHAFEDGRGMGYSFGFNRMENSSVYWNPKQLIHLLVDVVANGGNFLLDVGATWDGRIPTVMQNNLIAMGDWLSVNGEAIYGSRSWKYPQDKNSTSIYYTWNPLTEVVCAISTSYPFPKLVLTAPMFTSQSTVEFLGYGSVQWSNNGGAMEISVPYLTVDQVPCHHAYVFALHNVQ